MKLADLPTPALVVDRAALDHNLATMARARPRDQLRPHVKAHKSTGLARLQAGAGHQGFTCATVAEMEGLARAGLGGDLLLANEVLDCRRLGVLIEAGARVTVAVDSGSTVEAAVAGGVTEVVVDVNVGLPRCGCPPDEAGRLADLARARGLTVRGVMGYEGHVVGIEDPLRRAAELETAMELLVRAHDLVGGELVTGGGTGTFDRNRWVTECQAGSYLLMDTAYGKLGLPFRAALGIWSTVISSSADWSVCDAGLKALSLDHGNPDIEGSTVWFCSDEHTVFSPPVPVGSRVVVRPSHVDPTVALHRALHLVEGSPTLDTEVLDRLPVDLRGW